MIDFERLKEAYAVIDGIPEENFKLEKWTTRGGRRADYNTIACAAGWLVRHPNFKVKGFRLDKDGMFDDGFGYVEKLFGLDYIDAINVFRARGYSPLDDKPDPVTGAKITRRDSDKRVWQHRVRCFLHSHGQL